jgi:hypothetical protein
MILLTLLNYDTTNFTRLWIIAHLGTQGVNHDATNSTQIFTQL